MKLNVQFKEGVRHCWLLTGGASELFIQKRPEDVTKDGEDLICWVDVDHVEEIRADIDGETPEPDSVFLCAAGPEETKLYSVEEVVTYAGGDCLLFLKPMATFH